MTSSTQYAADASAQVIAGLILAAGSEMQRLGLPRPDIDGVLAATGAGRSRAYELAAEIRRGLPQLERRPGRPSSPSASPPPPAAADIVRRTLRFVMEHPGCVKANADRVHYVECFRRFVVDLREEHSDIEMSSFAEAVNVPEGTLKDWMRTQPLHDDLAVEPEPPADGASQPRSIQSEALDTIIGEWKAWNGTLAGFCDHLRDNKNLPYGRTLITHILEGLGLHSPRRRPGRSPDETALRGAFETFFPGAQWGADGSCIAVEINGERFDFNLELEVDADSGAFVGASISDTEDSGCVIAAFEDAVQTTGATPIAQLLDNRPCNNTDEVDEALGETKHIHSTRYRPQNNCHIEGGFGLFKNTAPPVVLNAASPRELAASILALVVQIFFRTLNHRPRRDRENQTRVDLYRDRKPTPEQEDEARIALEERRRKQDKARTTRTARQDPLRRHVLDSAFERLSLTDDTGKIRDAIARYPVDAIIDGAATFEGKRTAGTLPPDVDGRYLFGIVRNLSAKNEGMRIAAALWRTRLDARDVAFTRLREQREQILAEATEPAARIKALVGLAIKAEQRVERTFWLHAAAELVTQQDESEWPSLYESASRRVLGGFSLPYADRLDAIRYLAATLMPLP